MQPLLFTVALFAYLVVASARLPGLWSPPSWLGSVGRVALWVGAITHIVGIGLLAMHQGGPPVLAAGGTLVTLAAFLGAANVLMQRQPYGEALSGVLGALSAAMLGLGMLLPQGSERAPEALASLWFPIHAAMILLGLLGFALAFGVSALYLVVSGRLKAKRLGDLGRLPSIDALDALNTRFIVLGFLALTFGIAAGGLWATSIPDRAPRLGPTVYVTVVLWGWYAAAVMVRVVGGWRGRLAAHFSLVGFLGLLVSLGSIVAISRGWH